MREDYNDPEASYRRGFQQGACFAFEAAEEHLCSPIVTARLGNWVHRTLYKWRYGKTQGNRNILPPDPPK
jgi:hypothetical protein